MFCCNLIYHFLVCIMYVYVYVQCTYKQIQKIYLQISKTQSKMQAVINSVLSSPNKIPDLPYKLTPKDAQLLQSAIAANINRKNQSNILRVLLAQAYRQLNNQKCLRVVSQINIQGFPDQLQIDAKLKICEVINYSYDQLKADMVKAHVLDLNTRSSINNRDNKVKFDIVKAGYEALKGNYYKAATGFFNASKEQAFMDDQMERITLNDRTIGMCLLAQKTPELHHLICQLYVSPHTKKSLCHNLVNKMYSESMIDAKDMEPIRALMPAKFDKKDSDNISTLNKVIFKHNMSCILNCFDTISIQSLAKLFGVNINDLLIMIQKSFTQKQLQVDQISGYILIKRNLAKDQISIRNLFDSIEELITHSDK